jgi:hypothetical protein
MAVAPENEKKYGNHPGFSWSATKAIRIAARAKKPATAVKKPSR